MSIRERLLGIRYASPDEGAAQALSFTSSNPESTYGNPYKNPVLPANPERRRLAERWVNLSVRVEPYEAGHYQEGKMRYYYPKGERLIFGKGDEEQEVMNTFERPWVQATVEKMLNDTTKGPITVVEGGAGMRMMSQLILAKMIFFGGEYHIIELNRQLYEETKAWVEEKQEQVDDLGIHPLKLQAHFGDANEIIKEFKARSINRAFIDLHQLKQEERGMENLKMLDDLVVRGNPDDFRYTFCGFHRDNQTGFLDSKQVAKIALRFKDIDLTRVQSIPPRECTYMQWPNRWLPVVVCSNPIVSPRRRAA